MPEARSGESIPNSLQLPAKMKHPCNRLPRALVSITTCSLQYCLLVVCVRRDDEPEEGVSSSWRPHWSQTYDRYQYKNMANKQTIEWEPYVGNALLQ